jgi:hypothetical protein
MVIAATQHLSYGNEAEWTTGLIWTGVEKRKFLARGSNTKPSSL